MCPTRADPKKEKRLRQAVIDAAESAAVAKLEQLLAKFEAIGDPKLTRKMIGHGLAAAARHGHMAIVQRLLQHPSARAVEGDGYCNALCKAASGGHAEVVAFLLLSLPHADPGACGSAALVEAAAAGHLQAVQQLLSDGRVNPAVGLHKQVADIVRLDEYGDDAGWSDAPCTANAALRAAAVRRHFGVVDCLLNLPGTDPSADDNFLIRWAAWAERLDMVDRLMADARVDPSADGNFALSCAARWGNLPLAERLLADPRVDPAAGAADVVVDADSDTTGKGDAETCCECPFLLSVTEGNEAVVARFLADPRVYPAMHGNVAVKLALEDQHEGMLYRLLASPQVDAVLARSTDLIAVAAQHCDDLDPMLLPHDEREGDSEADGEAGLRILYRLLADPRFDPSALDSCRAVDALLSNPRVDPLSPVPESPCRVKAVSRPNAIVRGPSDSGGRIWMGDGQSELCDSPNDKDADLPGAGGGADVLDSVVKLRPGGGFQTRYLRRPGFHSICRLALQPAVLRSRLQLIGTPTWDACLYFLQLAMQQPIASRCGRATDVQGMTPTAERCTMARATSAVSGDHLSLCMLAWRRRCHLIAARDRMLMGEHEVSDGTSSDGRGDLKH